MFALNPRQKTSLAIALAVIVTVLGLHNPSDGYYNSHVQEPRSGAYSWQREQPGCGPEVQAELKRIDDDYASGPLTPRRMVEHAGGRRADIYRSCMQLQTDPPTEVSDPFLTWSSKGAMLPALATTKAFLSAILFVIIWAAVALYALRRNPRSQSAPE